MAAVEKNRKCAHPPCTCESRDKYCSAQCQAMEKTPDLQCDCGHPGCGQKTK